MTVDGLREQLSACVKDKKLFEARLKGAHEFARVRVGVKVGLDVSFSDVMGLSHSGPKPENPLPKL